MPKIAVACSGGGYRAMLSGAGMLAAMDNRTDGANEHGLGGLLQGATYLAGLSGGNWLTKYFGLEQLDVCASYRG
ncbi:Lysophospholipase 1 [Fusarium falciforme]|nr:Lysophospholipase 1 [Fusarium falciforme]